MKKYMLCNELNPCSRGCKRLWVVHYKSFLKYRVYIECTNCENRTKSFKKIEQAIEEWNRSKDIWESH